MNSCYALDIVPPFCKGGTGGIYRISEGDSYSGQISLNPPLQKEERRCRRKHTPIIYAFAMYLLVLLTLVSPAVSSAATLSIEAFLGFNEHFQPGHWTPLTLKLENRGRDIKGRLEVLVTSGSEYLQNIYQSSYSADVELPYNVTHLYAFSIKLNSFTHDVQIRLIQDNETFLERSISLRSAAIERPFVLVVDEKASPDFLSDFPPQVFPVNVRPKFLPEHSYAYESVRMMLLNIEMLAQLREKQFQALLRWIEQGGYLLLNGGMNVGAFSEPRARRLFPAKILGHREFHGLQTLEDFCGQNFRSAKPFLLLRVQSQDARVLLQEDDVPLLALRELEKGQVLFSAFHYQLSAFRNWEGKAAFWDKLFALHGPRRDADSPKLPVPQVQEAMFANLPDTLPDSGLLIVFLGMYLLLLRWFFRKIQMHRGRQWKNALAVAVLLLCAISGSFLLFRGTSKKVLSYNIFAHLHGGPASQQAEAQYITGLYTIQESAYRLLFDSASYPIEHLPPIPARGALPKAYQIHQSGKGQEVRGWSGDWRSQFFQLSATIGFPLSAEARLNEKGLELQLRNGSKATVQDAVLYFQQGLYLFGKMPADEERQYHIALADIRENRAFDPNKFVREQYTASEPEEVSGQDSRMTAFLREIFRKLFARPNASMYVPAMQKKLLPDVLDAVHASYQARSDVLCLVGWMPESPINMDMSQSGAKGESLTLLTWEIPLQKEK